ncbi:MAG: hypothetical protein KKF44_03675, partial [Nanoarchaeota archaeon]|nr:hypothetical protein [Nanoarchaeota archaeon]
MKKIQFYAIIAIVAFSIILTSCGQETDAQPTVVVEPSTAIDDVLHETWPENRQQSAGVVRFNNLVDNIEYNCEEGSDFYILDYKENKNLFLKIN